ncbi:MAG: DNA starvation/stationary phase protection protein [Cytophagales bacterium]|nr:DNA starvation/stationary phase protection protein [Cytophagales bacterium]
MEKLREQNQYEGNPVGLPDNVAQDLARELDRHLASSVVLFHQYHKHHWLVEGPQFRDLHLFFKENYSQVHEQFDKIAERMTTLGLTPSCTLENISRLSYIAQEPEGVLRIRQALEIDLQAERSIASELRKTIKKADDFQDYATKTLLEGFLVKTEERTDNIHHFLGEDSVLVPDYDMAAD